ncbi:MAG: hypothetical protein L6Q95_00825 [Planctomycetes bacterium]|nr:hypothetical protein [Planctomycetota bacterium]
MRRLLIFGVALGAGATGYFVGGLRGPEPSRTPPPAPPTYAPEEEERDAEGMPAEEQLAAVEAAVSVLAEDLPEPDAMMEALRRAPDGDQAQILLIGMVANAASRGPDALPGIRDLLASGVDLHFPEWDGKGLGYPSLRVALLAAAEATGDPAAAQLVAEVTRTSESPVEVVFGAHVLDRLKALDAPTAQRALDSLRKPLTKEQVQAMASIVGRVVPAAAAADPAYAEQFLMVQLRMPKGQGADPRFVAPVLDGIPSERARELVVANLTAADVSDPAKRMLAQRAAQRAELPMLQELKRGVEAGIYSKSVAATVAQSAVANRAYGRIERDAKRALKSGDLDRARALASDYHQWLTTTQQTIEAAQRMGAPLRKDLPTYVKLQQQRLDSLRNQIAKALKQQAPAK